MTLATIGEIAQQHHIGFIGNLHVTTALFEESENIEHDVQRCTEEGGRFPGYVFGLGGPVTQTIKRNLLDEAVLAYRARRERLRDR